MKAPAVEVAVGERVVRVSNPDRIVFPDVGVTKRDVVDYYVAVGDAILRAVGERPTMLRRFPDGVDGEDFFQKRVPKGAPGWVRTVRIRFPSGRFADEICPTEPAVLAWAAQMGTLEVHPWPVRRSDVDHPDELRVDLDPQPGTDFGDAVRVAGVLREVLDELDVVGYPKTSGGRGIHVLVRIRPEWDFVHVRRAVIALAREVERRMPDQATTSWWKEERGRRVFLDYNQAARDRTIASAWSVRGTKRATVSMPVTWDQMSEVDPDDFDVRTVPAILAEHGDAHESLDSTAFGIETLLEWFERDERNGDGGELPYPPEYPKMPGEPPRVQPSKRRRNTDEEEST
ncbi:ATP-dependent DNA ligase [Longimycelium tulufanense]|uniref:ATP-dependent DNA ligase n=1 Tax=Longimycelium tulufanense TaxID=907463 RepID=A0A8J3C8R7_9PSEU|nr:non-homologous end-joining DNA ligase [Longimycelium tulufanense]GGM55933.1 ATP-dependent DNA ligase [Longimycelium tulufanense]